MKKILTFLASIAIVTSASVSVIACGQTIDSESKNKKDEVKNLSDLSPLIFDFDNPNTTYDSIVEEVEKQITTAIGLGQKDAKINIDYQISKIKFDSQGRPVTADIIKVSATSKSKYLTGELLVIIQRDLTPFFNVQEWKRQGSVDESESLKEQVLGKIFELAPKAKRREVESSRTGDFFVKDNGNGSWSITSTDGNPLIRLTYNFNTVKEDISQVMINKDNTVFVKDDFENLKTRIQNALVTINPNVQWGRDYQIEDQGLETIIGGREIKITTTNSPRLKGQFKIFVKKIDLTSAIDLNNVFNVQTGFTTLRKAVFKKINGDGRTEPGLAHKLNAEENIDYQLETFNDETTKQMKVKVKSVIGSKLLTGGFEFSLKKMQLNNAIIDTGKIIGNEKAVVKQEVLKQINQYLSWGEVKHQISAADFDIVNYEDYPRSWEIKLKPNYFIQGKLTITVGTLDLRIISQGQSVVVGDNFNLVDDLIRKMEVAAPGIRRWPGTGDKLDYDYEIINENNQFTKAGEVVIKAIEKRNHFKELIKGKITITVKPKDIESVDISSLVSKLEDFKTLNQVVINEVNKLFTPTSSIKISAADFEIVKILENDQEEVLTDLSVNSGAGTFKIKAKPNSSSTIIGGYSKVFFIQKLIFNKTVDSVEVGFDYDKAITDALSLINGPKGMIPGLNLVAGVDYDRDSKNITNFGTRAGTVMLESLASSNLIAGTIKFDVHEKSIREVKFKSFERSTSVKTIREESLKKLQSLFPQLDQDGNRKITITYNDFAIFRKDGTQEVEIFDDSEIFEGTYVIKALNTKVIKDSFEFKIVANMLATLQDQFDDITISQDPELTLQKIQTAVNTLSQQELINNVHYEIINETNNLDNPLAGAGKIVVRALENQKYLNGEFSFNIIKFDLTTIPVSDFGEFKVNESVDFNQKILEVIRTKTQRQDIVEGVDYTIDLPKEWTATGKITIQGLGSSNLLTTNTVVLHFKPVSLAAINFASYELGKEAISYRQIELDVQKTIAEEFNNVLMEPQLGVDYEITGLNFDAQQTGIIKTNTVLTVSALNNKTFLLTGSNTIEINPLRDRDNNQHILDVSGSNYLLTPSASRYILDASYYSASVRDGDTTSTVAANQELDYTGGNPLKGTEVLAMSKHFLVTTRGVYFGPRLIRGTELMKWTADDVLVIKDMVLITTKGTWKGMDISETRNLVRWSAESLNGNFPNGMPTFQKADIIQIVGDDTFITTKGVWYTVKENSGKTITFYKSTSIPTSDLTTTNILYANENFIITKTGVFVRRHLSMYTDWTKDLDAVRINQEDILATNNWFVTIKNIGSIDLRGTIDKTALTRTTLAENKNYLMTTTGLYWQGELVQVGRWTGEDLLAINEQFIVIKGLGMFYQGVASKNLAFKNLTDKIQIFGMSENFIVTSLGSQFRDESRPNLPTIKSNELLGISKRFLVTTQGVWNLSFMDGSSAWQITKYNHNRNGSERPYYNINDSEGIISQKQPFKDQKFPQITAADFIAVNDYFLVSALGIWSYNERTKTFGQIKMYGDGQVGDHFIEFYPIIKDKADIVLLEGKQLLTKKRGFFFLDQTYWKSEDHNGVGWSLSDIITIFPNGKIYTRTKNWNTWNHAAHVIKN